MTFDNRLLGVARLALRSATPVGAVVPAATTGSTTTPRTHAPHRRFLPIPRPPLGWRENLFGLHPGEPATCRRDLKQFAAIWFHLALMLAIMKVYRIEGRGLFLLTSLAVGALPVHYLLAYRWKKPFFLAVSVAGLFGVFGTVAGLSVSALALGLIAVTRLPVAWVTRVSIVGLIGLGLGVARAGTAGDGSPWSEVVWPVLGSMLMFRIDRLPL